MKRLKLNRRELYLLKDGVKLFISYFNYNFFVSEFLRFGNSLELKNEYVALSKKLNEVFGDNDRRTRFCILEEKENSEIEKE